MTLLLLQPAWGGGGGVGEMEGATIQNLDTHMHTHTHRTHYAAYGAIQETI